MKRYVLGTNSLLQIISKHGNGGKYYIAWQKFSQYKFTLCLTSDILYEYEEMLQKNLSRKVAENVINQIIASDNIEFVVPYFKTDLITLDADDNKFVDCAIMANAEYIVSNDKHFDALKKIDFPKVIVRTLDYFVNDIKSL